MKWVHNRHARVTCPPPQLSVFSLSVITTLQSFKSKHCTSLSVIDIRQCRVNSNDVVWVLMSLVRFKAGSLGRGLVTKGHSSATQCHGGGRKRVNTQRKDRFILTSSFSDGYNSTEWPPKCQQTIRNRLQQAGLRSWRPYVRFPLIQHHIHYRLKWAKRKRQLDHQWLDICTLHRRVKDLLGCTDQCGEGHGSGIKMLT